MKYARLPIKIIQFDDLSILIGKGFLDGKLLGSLFKYQYSDNRLPIQITWRYRIYDQGNHIFSYVAETQAIIEKDSKETTDQDIEMMIINLALLFRMRWEEKTQNTPLYGNNIPSLNEGKIKPFIQKIKMWIEEIPLQ